MSEHSGVAVDLERGEVMGLVSLAKTGFNKPIVADVDGTGQALYTFTWRPSGWTAWLPGWARTGLYRMGVYVGRETESVVLRLRPGEQDATEVGSFGANRGGLSPITFAPGRGLFYVSRTPQISFSGTPQPTLLLGVDVTTLQVVDTLVLATEAYPAVTMLEPDSAFATTHLQPYKIVASPDGRWLAAVASYQSGRYWISVRGRGGSALLGSDSGGLPTARVIVLFDLDAGSVAFEQEVGMSGEPAFTSDGRALYLIAYDRPSPSMLARPEPIQYLLRLDLESLRVDTSLTLASRGRRHLNARLTPLPDRPSVVVRETDGRARVYLREFDATGAEVGGLHLPLRAVDLAASGATLYVLETPIPFAPNRRTPAPAPQGPTVVHHVNTSRWQWVRSDTLDLPAVPSPSFHVVGR